MSIWENSNFENTIIQQTASKSHNIFLLSLYEANKNIYTQQGISYGSSVNSIKRFYPAYLWDMYNLAQKMSTNIVSDSSSPIYGHYQLLEKLPWKTLFTSSFSDNSGSDIYENLKSFVPLAINNHPKFNAHKYSGSFNFSPLINISLSNVIQSVVSSNPDLKGLSQLVNDQAGAELIMYFIAKIPLFPFFISSSINSHYSYGPVFMNSMTFSCNGGENLGTVNVEVQFEGGKALVSPDVDLFLKKRPGIEPIVQNTMADLNGNSIYENATNFTSGNYNFDFHRYRSASLLDVIVLDEYEPNFSNLIAKVAGEYSGLKNIKNIPNKKITNISMTINQNLDIQHTIPTIQENGLPKQKPDSFGPRFASMSSRSVSGSITYFGYTDKIFNNLDKGLTLYFGGPFYFPMKNVDWSNPTISITPGGGYSHTYTFKARLPDQVVPKDENGNNLFNPVKVKFPYNKDNPMSENVSEFSYDSYTFNAKDFVQDYIDSFIRVILSALGIRSIK